MTIIYYEKCFVTKTGIEPGSFTLSNDVPTSTLDSAILFYQSLSAALLCLRLGATCGKCKVIKTTPASETCTSCSPETCSHTTIQLYVPMSEGKYKETAETFALASHVTHVRAP
jgi:hypothetical protein